VLEITAMIEDRHLTRAQVETALGKVGPLQSARLEWALRFCQLENLSSLTPGDRENLQLELAVFAFVAWMPDHGGGKGRTLTERFALTGEESYWPIPSWQAVEGAYATGHKLLSDLATYRRAEIGPFEMRVEVFHPPVHPKWKKQDREFFGSLDEIEKFYCRENIEGYDDLEPNYLIKFPYLLAQLLGRFAVNVGRCAEKECGRWFVALRVTRKFCSDRCKSRSAVRVMRARQRSKKGRLGKASSRGRKKRAGE